MTAVIDLAAIAVVGGSAYALCWAWCRPRRPVCSDELVKVQRALRRQR